MWKVYGLIDPRDEEIRYVGCTTAKYLSSRLNDHLTSARHQKSRDHGALRAGWLRGILAVDLRPRIVLLQTAFSKEEAAQVEDEWIQRFAGQLTNQLAGGPGAPNPSPELRQHRSEVQKRLWAKRPQSDRDAVGERGKASIRRAQARGREVWTGQKHSLETREKMRQGHADRRLEPEERRRRRSEANRRWRDKPGVREEQNKQQQRRRRAKKSSE